MEISTAALLLLPKLIRAIRDAGPEGLDLDVLHEDFDSEAGGEAVDAALTDGLIHDDCGLLTLTEAGREFAKELA